MTGRWAVSWAVAITVATGFLIPAVASASAGEAAASAQGTASPTVFPSGGTPGPGLPWPCYDPQTPPPSSPPLTPPPAPGSPQASVRVLNQVQMTWSASVDPDGIACYKVYEDYGSTQQKLATVAGDALGATFLVNWPSSGVASRVANLYVVAVDVWGAESPRSATVQVTIHNDQVPWTPTPVPGNCKVTYNSYSWHSGMTSTLEVTNTGSTTISGWRLTFTFPDPGQRVISGWSAVWSQTGSAVTAAAPAWNQDLKPGKSILIGFNGAHTGANPSPAAWQLNGATCR
ncbi:hypothetical protein Sru01_07490 [Sphaerisporangium rufum]|uniref:CBM2 domain-containing protein n=1 Tax=Sphaerisporangium rufum TaxID=1381558 RepID=A0A919QXG9_9ACTN|nr:cellulose binding domain-containing protein [Sphaerisporangium rufum]GII75767.1 hypothetical protein Sru01_07490 [Sphaerisporangium rufum]